MAQEIKDTMVLTNMNSPVAVITPLGENLLLRSLVYDHKSNWLIFDGGVTEYRGKFGTVSGSDGWTEIRLQEMISFFMARKEYNTALCIAQEGCASGSMIVDIRKFMENSDSQMKLKE